jgi:hypothetical protein
MMTAHEGQPFRTWRSGLLRSGSQKVHRICPSDPVRPNGRFAEVHRKVVEAPKVGFVSLDCSRFFEPSAAQAAVLLSGMPLCTNGCIKIRDGNAAREIKGT